MNKLKKIEKYNNPFFDAEYKPDDKTIVVNNKGILSAVTATANQKGIMQPDNASIIINSEGIISAATATASQKGIMQPDNTTTKVDNGLLSVPMNFNYPKITSSNRITFWNNQQMGATLNANSPNQTLSYTLPNDGYIFITCNKGSSSVGYTVTVYVNGQSIGFNARPSMGTAQGGFLNMSWLGRKGDVITLKNDLNSGTLFCYVYGWFYPSK